MNLRASGLQSGIKRRQSALKWIRSYEVKETHLEIWEEQMELDCLDVFAKLADGSGQMKKRIEMMLILPGLVRKTILEFE